MKYLVTISILFVTVVFATTSCKKDSDVPSHPRKVQYLLYTDKDFSTNSDNITFKLSIQNSSNLILWDSMLNPMKIRDIPNFTNKLVFEKSVPDNDTSILKVGFYYTIENVGNSWYLDTFRLGAPLKVVDFNFQ